MKSSRPAQTTATATAADNRATSLGGAAAGGSAIWPRRGRYTGDGSLLEERPGSAPGPSPEWSRAQSARGVCNLRGKSSIYCRRGSGGILRAEDGGAAAAKAKRGASEECPPRFCGHGNKIPQERESIIRGLAILTRDFDTRHVLLPLGYYAHFSSPPTRRALSVSGIISLGPAVWDASHAVTLTPASPVLRRRGAVPFPAVPFGVPRLFPASSVSSQPRHRGPEHLCISPQRRLLASLGNFIVDTVYPAALLAGNQLERQ